MCTFRIARRESARRCALYSALTVPHRDCSSVQSTSTWRSPQTLTEPRGSVSTDHRAHTTRMLPTYPTPRAGPMEAVLLVVNPARVPCSTWQPLGSALSNCCSNLSIDADICSRFIVLHAPSSCHRLVGCRGLWSVCVVGSVHRLARSKPGFRCNSCNGQRATNWCTRHGEHFMLCLRCTAHRLRNRPHGARDLSGTGGMRRNRDAEVAMPR